MVWNVCRSLIRDQHDAEDAFQATFLILVRKAGSLRVGDTMGPWLHVVAYRTALRVRMAAARRRDVERAAAARTGEAVEPTDGDPNAVPAHEIRAAIHAEIRNLPEAFRSVVVLCDLEGASYLEAAGRLRIPLGTVQSRLARARRRLRRNLRIRGIDPAREGDSCGPSDGPLCGLVTVGGPPASLVGRVGRLGAVIAAEPTSLTTIVAGPVQSLIRGGLRSMQLGTLRRLVAISMGGLLVGGAVLYAEARPGQATSDPARPSAPRVPSGDQQKRPAEIPAPRRLRVTSGHGKALLYVLDREGNRVTRREAGKVVRFQEAPHAIRWAVVTGLIDHDRIPKDWIEAGRKGHPKAEGLYIRVELVRRTWQIDGTWSGWKWVDAHANLAILDNLPEVEDERVPVRFLVQSLVDPLPHLIDGKWEGVDVEDFLPNGDKRGKDGPRADGSHLGPQRDLREGGLRHLGEAVDDGRHPGPWRDLAPVLMIRALDFTVAPGQTYRYRARVVLINPYYDRQHPGDRKYLEGPWSEATEAVTIAAS